MVSITFLKFLDGTYEAFVADPIPMGECSQTCPCEVYAQLAHTLNDRSLCHGCADAQQSFLMLAGILAFSSKTFCNLYLAAILGNADIALRIVNTGTYEARDTTSATGAAACGAGGTTGKISSPLGKSPRRSDDAHASSNKYSAGFSPEALPSVETTFDKLGQKFHVKGTQMELHDAFYDEHGTKLNLALHGGITLDMAPLCPYPDCEEKLQACLRKTKKEAPVYYNNHGDAIG